MVVNMNALRERDFGEVQHLIEIGEILRQFRKEGSATSVTVLPEIDTDWSEQPDITWFQNRNRLYGDIALPSAFNPNLRYQDVLFLEDMSSSTSLLLRNLELHQTLTPKQIMQAGKNAFEEFKAEEEAYIKSRGEEMLLLLDDND